jgi:opacity protein-like surface antigen
MDRGLLRERHPPHRTSSLATLGLALLAGSVSCFAQAAPTAKRAHDISVFAEYARLHPDYGPPLNGLTVGFDVAHPIRFRWVTPALEVRANYAGETVLAGEELVIGGLRLGLNVVSSERFKPYLNFLVGAGQINFHYAEPYTKDNSMIYNYGAGFDYELVRNFALKIEFQHQAWDLGQKTSDLRDTLAPSSYNAGLSYRIPSWRRH